MLLITKSIVLLLTFTFFCAKFDIVLSNDNDRIRFIRNLLESEEASNDYCDCVGPDSQPIYICFNYYAVDLIQRDGGSYYGNVTFVRGEVAHITCKAPSRQPVDIRIVGIAGQGYEIEIDNISASDIDIKLSMYDSYRVECLYNDKGYEVFLTNGGSYIYPVEDVPANVAVNGSFLSLMCMKSKLVIDLEEYKTSKYIVKYFNAIYFTYPDEILTVDAKFRRIDNTIQKFQFYEKFLSESSVGSPYTFEYKRNSKLVCHIIVSNKSSPIILVYFITIQFMKYRIPEPFVNGLSWSRITKRYESNSQIVAEYSYNTYETLQLTVVTKDPETKVTLDKNELKTHVCWLGGYFCLTLKIYPSMYKALYATNKYGSNSVEFKRRYTHIKVLVRTSSTTTSRAITATSPTLMTVSPTPKPTRFREITATSPTLMTVSPTPKPTRYREITATSPTLMTVSPTPKPTRYREITAMSPTLMTVSPTPITTSKTTKSPKPTTLQETTAMSPTPKAMSPISPTSPATDFTSSGSIIAIVIGSITLGILIGAVSVRKCYRAAEKRARAEPCVVYTHRESHIYEEVQYGIDISKRPPHPLPTEEAIDENRPYIHYETPYEWRLPRLQRWIRTPIHRPGSVNWIKPQSKQIF